MYHVKIRFHTVPDSGFDWNPRQFGTALVPTINFPENVMVGDEIEFPGHGFFKSAFSQVIPRVSGRRWTNGFLELQIQISAKDFCSIFLKRDWKEVIADAMFKNFELSGNTIKVEEVWDFKVIS